MAHGLGKLYSTTVAVGSGGSATINLNRTYAKVFLHIPAPGAAFNIQGSVDGTNYAQLCGGLHEAVSGAVSFLSTHSNQVRTIPGGLQYYKFINTLATGAAEVIRVWGTDL